MNMAVDMFASQAYNCDTENIDFSSHIWYNE